MSDEKTNSEFTQHGPVGEDHRCAPNPYFQPNNPNWNGRNFRNPVLKQPMPPFGQFGDINYGRQNIGYQPNYGSSFLNNDNVFELSIEGNVESFIEMGMNIGFLNFIMATEDHYLVRPIIATHSFVNNFDVVFKINKRNIQKSSSNDRRWVNIRYIPSSKETEKPSDYSKIEMGVNPIIRDDLLWDISGKIIDVSRDQKTLWFILHQKLSYIPDQIYSFKISKETDIRRMVLKTDSDMFIDINENNLIEYERKTETDSGFEEWLLISNDSGILKKHEVYELLNKYLNIIEIQIDAGLLDKERLLKIIGGLIQLIEINHHIELIFKSMIEWCFNRDGRILITRSIIDITPVNYLNLNLPNYEIDFAFKNFISELNTARVHKFVPFVSLDVEVPTQSSTV